MAQNITLLGASYSDVPAVLLPKTGGGTARFDDASVTTATASDVASGKVFVASDGTITTGTASGGGGGGLTLINTTSIGALSTTSTSGVDTGKTISLASTTGWQDYDLLIVDISVNTTTNGANRVERGCGYHKEARACYSAYRTSDLGNKRYRKVGFRVVSRVE